MRAATSPANGGGGAGSQRLSRGLRPRRSGVPDGQHRGGNRRPHSGPKSPDIVVSFGSVVLPVLSETVARYGVGAADMACASITGQPFHLQSPLVPAILLLVSLAKVGLGDHHKKVLWGTAVISLVTLAVGVLTGAIGIG